MPDWLDTPADAVVVLTLFSILMGGLVWVIKAQISMQKEFKPNGGSSTRDQLDSMSGLPPLNAATTRAPFT